MTVMELKVYLCMCVVIHCILLTSCVREIVLFADSNNIMEFDVDTRNVTVLFAHAGSEVNAMDYDYRNRYVYFPRYSRHDIMRFKYPSENRTLETVVQTQKPVGIAIDSVNGHLYWINYQENNTLSRSDLDGTNVLVVSTPLRDTFAIRLDLSRRWLYMVDRYYGISKSRYNLDEHKTIVNFHPERVDCIDIDKPSKAKNRKSHENKDFAVNEKVMGFWKPEKKWYNATVLEKTKSGYKVVFADDNLVRVLSLQNLRNKTSR